MNNQSKEKILNYKLIQYEGYSPESNKVWRLTAREAHNLNYSLAINRTPKRYIRLDE